MRRWEGGKKQWVGGIGVRHTVFGALGTPKTV
jgi:hypothetical protein